MPEKNNEIFPHAPIPPADLPLPDTNRTWEAAIPDSERAVLDALFAQTNGPNWTVNTGWGGPRGTECTWYGITCNAAQTHITAIDLPANNLQGSLPSNLNQLTELQRCLVFKNHLTGPIPEMSGLTVLKDFYADNNQLSGPIPNLTGLSHLSAFSVYNNHLTGSIPSLDGLTSLQWFDVDTNFLTGPIPPLGDLIALQYFNASANRLTGPIPPVGHLTNLRTFSVARNRLSGPIPTLNPLIALQAIDMSANQLSGPMPSLRGLCSLKYFYIHNNQLSGAVQAVPSPINRLLPGGSALCPNQLTPSPDSRWDTATGTTPWHAACSASLIHQGEDPAPSTTGTPGPTGLGAPCDTSPSVPRWRTALYALIRRLAGPGANLPGHTSHDPGQAPRHQPSPEPPTGHGH